MSNRAWVTLATNDSYGLGALVVAHSLRRSGSVYPAVVLITPSVTEAMRERLRAVFAEVVMVDVLDSRDAAHLALLQRPELGVTFTKIHCWSLTQYDKCVFLDADTLIVQNCDELFEREELSAAPDVGWPDCFNSGVFVFRPSADTFSNLITFASERGSFDGGDQGLLNSYFSDWAQGDISKHLPFLYNVTSAAFYSYIPAIKHYGQNLKIIHFIGVAKPWLQHFNWQTRSVDAPDHLREFLQLWWDLFVGQVHSQLDTAMGEVIADPVAILEEERVHYNEPSVNYSYYKPSLDSHSEFPWHHPETQPESLEMDMPEIDMSEIYNPWDIYGGNIPAHKEDFNQNEKNTVDFQEIRKYAWDYVQPHNNQYQTDSRNYEQTFYSTEHNLQHNNDNYHCERKDGVWPSEYQSSPNVIHTNVHLDASDSDNYHLQQHHEHRHYEQKSQQGTQEHHHNVQQYHHENIPTIHHSYCEQHVQEHKHAEPQHTHENHYSNFKQPEENNYTSIQQHNNESQNENHVCHIHNLHEKENQVSTNFNSFTTSLFKTHNRPQIYTVMMDHTKVNQYVVPEEKMNGYASDDESDFEEITPRHPYDGFYLRHRMTIDSRGRKICTHEIPLRPPSPPSESSEEFEDAMETFAEEITNKAINGEDSQTGVAGNLARVVPGEPLQQEAVDELTRRQGWEAGNIDYMGADSFDNIWAKISQTLSTPPSSEQQEPAKEKAPETVADPPSEPAPLEAAKEPESTPVEPAPKTAPTSESVPVEALLDNAEKSVDAIKEQKVEETRSEVAPVEFPKPVESVPVEKSSEAAAPPEEAPAVVQPTPVEVPVPVEGPAATTESSEAAGKPEEIIPVPVEAAAVELPASVESATEVKEKTEPESAEIPVVALEALKIGESAVAEVVATVESAAPISESTPTKELKPAETAKPDAASDSPPLAHTPSKEEIPVAPAAKSEERRKPAGKLQLRPPLAPDPALTPDSEAEDAAALAHAIISSELRTPTVTAPTPPTLSPADQPCVSLSQIGVKSKPTTAARIESSVKADSAPSTPESPKPAEAPKKKIIKKVVKKKEEGAASGEAPVPPPRKKEKKPKET